MKCYSKNIEISEIYCKIPIQDLLDHTINRIFQTTLLEHINSTMSNFKIICKWEYEGSSQQAQYKQVISSSVSTTITDRNLFMSFFFGAYGNSLYSDK